MFTPFILDALQTAQTPLYFYDLPLLQQTIEQLKSAANQYKYHVHYAIKANNNPRILKQIQTAGLGADCVSGGEIELAILSGFPASEIVFAGVGKTDMEIKIALKHDIFAFNVESVQELQVLALLADQMQTCARVALRINPNVDAQTHHYITTGLDENKFGILTSELADCLTIIEQSSSLRLLGLHFHVGSQITDLQVFKSLCVKVNEWNQWFIDRGHTVEVLNLGGGLGIDYFDPDANAIPDFHAFFEVFHQFLDRKPQQQVHFELGRSVVGQCGSLISRVLYIKNGIKKNFAILDAGMTELLRPSLYQAYHKVEKINQFPDIAPPNTVYYDVVGPICESSDCFAKELALPMLQRGDYLAIRSAGAYGEVMASRYNLRQPLHFLYREIQ